MNRDDLLNPYLSLTHSSYYFNEIEKQFSPELNALYIIHIEMSVPYVILT